MSSALLEEVVEETKTLPPAEREVLREIMGNGIGALLLILGLLHILNKLKGLDTEELVQVRAAVLELLPSPSEEELEDEFERALIIEGLLLDRGEISQPSTSPTSAHAFKPVPVTGKLVSEFVIEERR